MDSSSLDPNNSQNDSLDSLEGSSTVIEPSVSSTTEAPHNFGGGTSPVNPDSNKPPKQTFVKRLLGHLNVYLLLFVFILVISGVAIFIAYQYNSSANEKTATTGTQSLSQSTLDQLANSDVTVGDAKQTLSVQSNAVFAGKVLVRDSLEVAGGLQVGGDLTLTGIKVSGNSVFDSVQITKDLAVTGNTGLQGSLAVQKDLAVNGSGAFSGALSASKVSTGSLQMSGDLNLTHHIAAGGGTPSRSNGSALGSGGTASISGSDTAGSITINTGGGPSAGCFLTVNFASHFNATPHIIITPVGSSAAGINYYINRSTSNFSVCTTSTPPANQTFGFDYIAFD